MKTFFLFLEGFLFLVISCIAATKLTIKRIPRPTREELLTKENNNLRIQNEQLIKQAGQKSEYR